MRTAPFAAVAASVVLSACGSGSGDTAIDPGTEPTTRPTVGSYPSFAPQDYTYVLRVTCFCPGSGDPVGVRVENGAVTDAVYTTQGEGHDRGDRADRFRWLTINDVIDAANDTGAYSVEVEWPAGQDHPDSVHVDQDDHTIDEEIGYAISDVVVEG